MWFEVRTVYRFTRREFADCLSKFGYLYARMMSTISADTPPNLETLVELNNLTKDVESACRIDLSGVRRWIEVATEDLYKNPEAAKYDLHKAFARLVDELRLMRE